MGDRPADWDAARVRDFDEAAARYSELRADLGAMVAAEIAAGNAAQDRKERCLDLHGYGCDRAECGRAGAGATCPGRGMLHPGSADHGPEYACAACFWQAATSADLLELDAVPDPVDSDASGALQPPGTALREYLDRDR